MFWKPSIRFVEIDTAELSQCRSGDKLKLWTSPDYEWIHAYRPRSAGGKGKVGTLSKADNRRIASALADGLPVWLDVLSIEGTKVNLEAKFMTREEVTVEKSSAASKLKAELLKPLRKHEPMSIELRAPVDFQFNVGQRYAIDLPSVDEYTRKPTLDVALTSPEGFTVRAIPPAPQRRLLLRAHFGGMDVHILVIAVTKEIAWAGDRGGVWKESAATARAVILKRHPHLAEVGYVGCAPQR